VLRHLIFKEAQAVGRRISFLIDIDLDRDRDTTQCPRILTAGNRFVHPFGRLQCIFTAVLDYGVDLGVYVVEALQMRAGNFTCGHHF